jgi:hypothetical protein
LESVLIGKKYRLLDLVVYRRRKKDRWLAGLSDLVFGPARLRVVCPCIVIVVCAGKRGKGQACTRKIGVERKRRKRRMEEKEKKNKEKENWTIFQN